MSTPSTQSRKGSKTTPREQAYVPSRGSAKAMKRGVEAIASMNPTKRVTTAQRGALAFFTLQSSRSND